MVLSGDGGRLDVWMMEWSVVVVERVEVRKEGEKGEGGDGEVDDRKG